MSASSELNRRVSEFAHRCGLELRDQLGYGIHGIVFLADSLLEKETPPVRSAVKVHRQEPAYLRERDVYLRLRDRAITFVRECRVPQLLRYDDDLLVIEMTVVKRPFLLDFGGAYLDKAPDFSEEVLADWRAEKQEQFESRWPEVQAILRALEAMGILMLDVNPGNISFGD